jgi:hypothetical protein
MCITDPCNVALSRRLEQNRIIAGLVRDFRHEQTVKQIAREQEHSLPRQRRVDHHALAAVDTQADLPA